MQARQLIFVGCGIFFVVLTIKHVIAGRRTAYWGGIVERENAPGSFWLTIALDAMISIAFLAYAIMQGGR